MIGDIRIKLSDLIMTFSRVLDFVNQKVSNHHLRVAVIASAIARESGMISQDLNDVFLASAIHDIGAFSTKEKFDALEFEMINPHVHTERGYLLVRHNKHFLNIANIIRYHHLAWSEGEGRQFNGEDVPPGAHILHLADRIEVLINRNQEVLDQRDAIRESILSRSGSTFMPELVEIFESLSLRESFWFDAASPEISRRILDTNAIPGVELNIEGLTHISRLFSNIIDYRSPFTAVHSSGVSAVATTLAQMTGFSEIELDMVRIAGYLHDVGKLAVPLEILDKPGRLTTGEFNIIKSHVYHSYRILEGVPGLETINMWGSLHHERIDGTGYPFHLKGSELPMVSRIMAVADVFTAITEDRPYRKGMNGKEALRVIEDMAGNNALDHSIVGIASAYFKHLNDVRIEAQEKAREGYLSVKLFAE